MTTRDYKSPVSLSVLWKRWEELEELDDHYDKVHAEFDAIEASLINQPEKTIKM
jgi:hypothetical protein